MIKKPLLAEELESLDQVKLPVYASPKLDGIRCLIVNGRVLSRSFKEIPNNWIRSCLEVEAKEGFDGELLTYTDGTLDDFNVTQSKVMREEGEPDFVYAVFDYVLDSLITPFSKRIELLNQIDNNDIIEVVPTILVDTVEQLKDLEKEWVRLGHEGIMVRSPDGRYKCGRSTLKEGILLKYKRFDDSEAKIIEIREQQTFIGVKGVNELGNTKRSSKKADLALAGTTGEFWVKDIHNGKEFGIGTGIGLTKELRQEIWNNQDKYLNKIIKYKYQGFGSKGKPRFPSWLGFRHEQDMS